VNKSAEEDGGCDWFEWAEMDDEGENIHPLRNKKTSAEERETTSHITRPQKEA